MNYISILTIISVLASIAYAQTTLGAQSAADINFSDSVVTEAELDVAEQSFSNPDIAPDSPLHVFKRIGEFFREALARNREEKARLHLAFARERLTEARYLARKNRTGEALKYVDEYESEINKSRGIGANVSVIAKETEDTLLKSALVLELVREKAPASAQPALARAINNSLEKKARIKTEMKAEESAQESISPVLPSGGLAASTIAAPPTKEEVIESAVKKELEMEKERQESRRKSLERIEKKKAEKPTTEKGRKLP